MAESALKAETLQLYAPGRSVLSEVAMACKVVAYILMAYVVMAYIGLASCWYVCGSTRSARSVPSEAGIPRSGGDNIRTRDVLTRKTEKK